MSSKVILAAFFAAMLLGAASAEPQAKQAFYTATLKISKESALTEAEVQRQIIGRAEAQGLAATIELGKADDRTLTLTLPAVSLKEAQSRFRRCRTPLLTLQPVHPDNDALTAKGAESPPVKGFTLYSYERENEDGEVFRSWLFLGNDAQVTSEFIKNAYPGAGQPLVHVELSEKGAATMRKLTKRMRKGVDRLAVVVDGKVATAPVVNDILSSNLVIEGFDDPNERQTLAAALRGKKRSSVITIHDLRQANP